MQDKADVSANLGTSFANVLLVDLRAMGLFSSVLILKTL